MGRFSARKSSSLTGTLSIPLALRQYPLGPILLEQEGTAYDCVQSANPARRGRALPCLSALEERDPNHVRRRSTPCPGAPGRRAARRQGGSGRKTVRGTGG